MSMQRLMLAEFFKLRKRMMTWIVAGLTIALIVLLYSVMWSMSGRAGSFFEGGQRFSYQDLRRGLFLEAGVPFALQIIATFGTLLAVVLAAGAAGSEYAWGTVRLMATASSGRLRLITARLVVVFCMVALIALMAIAVALAYSAVITTVNGGSDFSFVTAGFLKEQTFAFGRTLFVMSPFVALAFAAAIVGRSTLAGVGVGLAVAFLEPLISNLLRLGGSPWTKIPNYLIDSNRDVIIAQNRLPAALQRFSFGPSTRELASRGSHSPEAAAMILALWVAAFITISFVVYRRRDITSASTG
ncbi:MAG: ABC transporter permease [Chloroflexota bacterium]|nr:ABC transporter permease [Chloroflexota bacterium]